MKLNDLHYAPGSRPDPRRVGRGPGSDMGKTAGRGHKGQHSRSGGYTKVGFEGGQMPLQRRIPKRGFRVPENGTHQVRMDALGKLSGEIDLGALKAAGLVPRQARQAKIIASGELNAAVTLKGVAVTRGARAAIEAAGGTVSE